MNEPAPQPFAWLGENPDPVLLGHAQNKAWTGPIDAVKAHMSAEQLIGADRAGRTITLPKDDADADGWKAFREKIGVPEKPEAYELPVPQGDDGKFSQAAAQWLHKHGIPKKAAQGIAAEWNAYQAQQRADMEAAEQAALQQEHEALARDWGPAAEQQKELARRAAQKFGMDEAAINALEKAVGFSKVMKLFAQIGEMSAEDKGLGLDTTSSFKLTPEAAMARKTQIMADTDWRAKASVPNSAQWSELTRLNEIIAQSMRAE